MGPMEIALAEARAAAARGEVPVGAVVLDGAGTVLDRVAAQPVIDRHQALMWEVGELMHRWEELQATPADK